MKQMQCSLNSLANRHIADDAKAAFDSFHSKGGHPFHEFSPAQLRENYVSSTAVSGMPEVPTVTHQDYEVDTCTIRVYEPQGLWQTSTTPGIVYLHGGGWVMGNLATWQLTTRSASTLRTTPANLSLPSTTGLHRNINSRRLLMIPMRH